MDGPRALRRGLWLIACFLPLTAGTPAMAEVCDKIGSLFLVPGPGLANALVEPVRIFTTTPGLVVLGLAILALMARNRWLPLLAACAPAVLAAVIGFSHLAGGASTAEVNRSAVIEGCQGPIVLSVAILAALAGGLVAVGLRRLRHAA